MVYVKRWSEFQTQGLDLYRSHPLKTRYLIKIHPATQWLVLKLTNDETTIKYRTRSTAILNRFESFNRDMIAAMANKPLPSVLEAEAAAAATETTGPKGNAGPNSNTGQRQKGGAVSVNNGPNTTTSESGGTGSGGKKKKKKGKK